MYLEQISMIDEEICNFAIKARSIFEYIFKSIQCRMRRLSFRRRFISQCLELNKNIHYLIEWCREQIFCCTIQSIHFIIFLLPVIPFEPITAERLDVKNREELKHALKQEGTKLYEAKEAEFPNPEMIRELERVFLLKVIDRKWMNHIDDMEQLRQGIGLQAYGQRDPKVEYKMSAFEMFDEMIAGIQQDTVRLLYHVRIEQKVEREQVAEVTGTNKDEEAKGPVRRAQQKVYPNDPCPCGSGKKYKQCCGRKPV